MLVQRDGWASVRASASVARRVVCSEDTADFNAAKVAKKVNPAIITLALIKMPSPGLEPPYQSMARPTPTATSTTAAAAAAQDLFITWTLTSLGQHSSRHGQARLSLVGALQLRGSRRCGRCRARG